MGKKDKLRGVWPHLRSLAVVSLILLLVTGIIFGVSMLRQALSDGGPLAAMGETVARGSIRPEVVVDPGHGGIDGGAIGVDGSVENEINLSISLTLRDILALFGYDVRMTREDDVSLGSEEGSVRQQKRGDLEARLAVMEEDPARPVIMIHQNTFSEPVYSGAQMFYGSENAASQALAESVRQSVVSLLQPDNTRELKPAPSDVWILHQTTAPVVMAECGFLSNPGECALLNDGEYRCRMAFAVAAGVAGWAEDGA